MNDSTRFERLVSEHHHAVATFALSLTNDRWHADEATHLTFVRAWKYLDSFRGDGSFEGWLLRICRDVIIDQAAGRYREVPVGRVPDRLVYDQDLIAVESLLSGLPLPQREAITLCAVLGYDYQSAADILGVPVGTVRSRLNRARASLRRLDTSEGAA